MRKSPVRQTSGDREAVRLLDDIGQLAPLLEPGGRLMGLDLGTKTIGIALSDPAYCVAGARETLRRGKFADDAARLIRLIAAENVRAVILGLPLNMNGSSGPRVQATRAFARNFAAKTAVPVALWDERLSTAAVERILIDAGCSRVRRGQVVDKLAASYMLQAALDRLAAIRQRREHQASRTGSP